MAPHQGHNVTRKELAEASKTPSSSPPYLTACGRYLTETKAFEMMAARAFEVCDDSGDGIVDEAELYAGVLLVHLNLAKYAGPSACYPPTRAVCDRLFATADHDRSGGIDQSEFRYIAGILCAQILSRMLVYYLVLILGVPILATMVVQSLRIPKDTYFELATRESVSCATFAFAIPLLWNKIDERYSSSATNMSLKSRVSDDDRNPGESLIGSNGVRNSPINTSEAELLLPPSRRQQQRQRRRQRKSIQLELGQIQQSKIDDLQI